MLAEVAEREALNNQTKLTSSAAREAHLWIWLEFDADDGADAMAHSVAEGLIGGPPRDPDLKLPCTVWLAVPTDNFAVRWREQDGWAVIRRKF